MKTAWCRHWQTIRLSGCECHEPAGAAMVAVLQRDDVVVASISFREQCSEVIGL